MLTVYIVSAAVALLLIGVSMFGHDQGHEADHDADAGHDHGGDAWVPFLSLRFWTYGLAAFGLIGTALEVLGAAGVLRPWIAGGGGLALGLGISFALHAVRRGEVSSGAASEDLMGKLATMLVAARPHQPGKARCTVKGDVIDVIAVAEGDQAIEAGEQVVLLHVENGRALVARTSDLID